MEDIFDTKSESSIDYQHDFEEFQNRYKIAQCHPEEIGVLIVKMAGYFGRYNMQYAQKLKSFSHVKAKLITSMDERTGKPTSAAAADVLADATEEAAAYEMARIHLANIQEYLNSLKMLQRALSTEYANQG